MGFYVMVTYKNVYKKLQIKISTCSPKTEDKHILCTVTPQLQANNTVLKCAIVHMQTMERERKKKN
jgi:hypothetical protein